LNTINNPFLISLITTLVNVCSTPISFWLVERVGRRNLLIFGGTGMVISQYIVGIVGVTVGQDKGDATNQKSSHFQSDPVVLVFQPHPIGFGTA
jgi:MFS family permease